jgi:hypothetical protein
LVDTIQPFNVQSRSDKPRAFLAVSSFNLFWRGGQCVFQCNGLAVWSYSTVLVRTGSPGAVSSEITVATPVNHALPPSAGQPGARNSIDTGEVRISGPVYYAAGSMFAAVNTNKGGGGPGILAWQIRANRYDPANSPCTRAFLNACPVLASVVIENQFNLDVTPSGGTVANAFYGTIVPDPERNFTTVFNFSGDGNYASVNYISSRVSQPPRGTAQATTSGFPDGGLFLRTVAAAYSQGTLPYRWGDYTAVANELLDPATGSGSTTPGMWITGMYAGADELWHTAIGRNGFTQSNQP